MNYEDIEVLDHIWFNGVIGIVLAANIKTQKQCAYIGLGKGFCSKVDCEIILAQGAPLHLLAAVAFFNYKVQGQSYERSRDALMTWEEKP